MTRTDFFGDALVPYDGELNTEYNGLSYVGKHLTHIDKLTDNEATGFCVGKSGRKIPFFALKNGDKIGIGYSYANAADDLLLKEIIGVPEETRIKEFVDSHKKDTLYTVGELWNWHRRLTGACYNGGEEFLEKHSLKKEDLRSVQFFILITANDFGGDIIQRLKPYYFEKGDPQTLEDIKV